MDGRNDAIIPAKAAAYLTAYEVLGSTAPALFVEPYRRAGKCAPPRLMVAPPCFFGYQMIRTPENER